ncbi:MAG: pyridoxal-phosphate dependent enzyme, partial [Gammaproteobacteria bacterium]|nr:pyridoxal-phosphate dependent enzyme [Gammaproteobacteria bacterium]
MIAAALNAPTLNEIRAAASLLAPYVIRTPLLRLNIDDGPNEIYLKLENLQPIGVFKVRSMGNAMLTADKHALRNGAYTASSGNAGLGLAWIAQQLGVAATVYAPHTGPSGKLEGVRNFGADVHLLGDDQWWKIIKNSGHPTDPGWYVDAVRSPAAMAGNGTIGLEIIEQLPDVDTVIVPFGGGGVACGVASAIRALKPDTRLIVSESDAAAPLTAAFKAGRPVPVAVKPSFISGAGAPSVLEEMWPLLSEFVDSTVVSPVTEVAAAVRLLIERNHVVAEGAGAIPVAGALA